MTDDILKVFESDGLKAVSEILKREEDITPFEKNLITSIRFCALSTRDKQMTNAFVNSIISLEALLLKMGEAKADNLAERVAFVVGQDLYERNWFFDQMRRLYGTRNSIVHSGHSDIQRSDLLLLQNILNYRCIVNLLKSYKTWKIENTSDLIRWIREQKFS